MQCNGLNFAKVLLRALGLLVIFDVLVHYWPFEQLERWTGARRPSGRGVEPEMILQITKAVEYACMIYPKTAVCLQRSCVLTRLLRLTGVNAQCIIGVQQFPFRSHSWVEVSGVPLIEGKRVREVYAVLDCWGQSGEARI